MPYALALCLLLAVILTVVALRRPDQRRRGLRVGAGLVAVAGVWLAAFPPASSHKVPTPQAAILLTDGYSPDSLRHLLRRLGASTPLWRYQTTATSTDTPMLSNLAALRQQLPALQRLHVVGNGLPAADALALQGLKVVTHTSAASGFQAATWNRQPELGRPWAVEGAFAHASGPIWVSLHAAGAPRDSVRLASGHGNFRLRFTPKAEGRAVYWLEARREGKRIAREPVPLEVQATRPLRVLVLAAAPSFEVRFLKNYLAAHQHSVALRTGLSRGLTQTEFLNVSSPPDLGRLTPALLARFMVLVADAGALASLSGAEAEALSRAVRTGTCGALLLADSPTLPRQLPGSAAFQLQALSTAAVTTQPVRWPEAPGAAATLLAATLHPGPNLRALVTDARQQAAAAVRRVGMGQVVVTTAVETFPWLLQGQAATYQSYWSQLLTAVAPPQLATTSISPLDAWPHPHAPLTLRATGPTSNALTLTEPAGATIRAALQQDRYLPEWATATYWPSAEGWHQASNGTAKHWFYVFGAKQWQGPARQAWQQAVAQLTPDKQAASVAVTRTTSTSWPRWWGYALFLLAAGLLWLEEKL
ncbi:hypothetical protein [Hymenobacter tenuis]